MPSTDDIFEKYGGKKFPERRGGEGIGGLAEETAEGFELEREGLDTEAAEKRRRAEKAEHREATEKIEWEAERPPKLSPEEEQQMIKRAIELVEEKGIALSLKSAGETGDREILEAVITGLVKEKGQESEKILEAAQTLNDPWVLDITRDTLRYLEG